MLIMLNLANRWATNWDAHHFIAYCETNLRSHLGAKLGDRFCINGLPFFLVMGSFNSSWRRRNSERRPVLVFLHNHFDNSGVRRFLAHYRTWSAGYSALDYARGHRLIHHDHCHVQQISDKWRQKMRGLSSYENLENHIVILGWQCSGLCPGASPYSPRSLPKSCSKSPTNGGKKCAVYLVTRTWKIIL